MTTLNWIALAALLALPMVWGTAPALAADAAQLEANKKNVIAFYEAAINEKDFAKAEPYMGDRYIQHNPNAPDGKEGLKGFLKFLKEKFPGSHSTIKRAFAEGDFVILHVHAVRVPGTRGNAIVDIFRLENGKVVEHWDVIQEIPEQPKNNNTMF